MSTYRLPTLSDGTTYYDFEVILDGSTYTFEFQWNERDGSWYFSIYKEGVMVSSGMRVVLRWPLLNKYGLKDAPPGELIVIDLDGTGLEAGLYDLGSRVVMDYIEAADIR